MIIKKGKNFFVLLANSASETNNISSTENWNSPIGFWKIKAIKNKNKYLYLLSIGKVLKIVKYVK